MTDAIKLKVRAVECAHPRLLLTSADENGLAAKIAVDSLLQRAAAHVIELADQIQGLTPVVREVEGRRLLAVSRTCLKRVLYLALAYRLTKDHKHAERAREEMLAAASFEDWNPSHFLDVSEMTTALAIGYDWLYDVLETKAQTSIREAIVEKGLRVSLQGGTWVAAENNWNQVCHAGLVLGALAVVEDERAMALQIVERAVENLPVAMAEYAPDGAYPEGPTYWSYGTTYNVILLAALESVLGTDFGLAQAPGFLESSDYYMLAAGPTGQFFNYSDCGLYGGVSPAMHWFAAKRNNASILWRERKLLADFLAAEPSAAGQSDRFFPLLLLWAQPNAETAAPTARHIQFGGRTPLAIHRSGWSDADTFVAIKGGSPSANHAHMDIGSFVLDADGVRWAADLGPQNYHDLESKGIRLWGKEQDSQRWQVFRLNNFCHNTLVVDGQLQQVVGDAPIVAFSGQGPMPHTVVDLQTVYAGQLLRAQRGVALLADHSVLVQDEVAALSRNTSLRWAMLTEAEVQLDGARAVLRQDGKELLLSLVGMEGVEWQVFESAEPPQSYDAANPGTRMVGFVVELLPDAQMRWGIHFVPGGGANEPPVLRPLASW